MTWTPSRSWPLFCGIAGSTAAIDLGTKWLLFDRLGMPGDRPPIVIVPGMLTLETNLNEGALFGMGQGMGMLFAAVSCLAVVGILYTVSRPAARDEPWLLVALGLITGGILGNLYDRVGWPALTWHAPLGRVGEPVFAVRDWIHVRLQGIIDWPIFNLADSWLVIGAAMLVLLSFRAAPGPTDHAE